jgi:hypothetical protein
MAINDRVRNKIFSILDLYADFPEIKVCPNDDDPLSGEFLITGHPPLTVIKYNYVKQQHLISFNYDLCLSIYDSSFVTAEKTNIRDAISGHNKLDIAFIKKLSSSPAATLIQSTNEWQIIIQPKSNGTLIELSPYIGNITQLTLPPVVNAIVPSHTEILQQLEALQIIKSCFP